MTTPKEIFKKKLEEKGDKSLLDAKYIGVSADEIIDCYNEMGLKSPITLIENTWLKNWYSNGLPMSTNGWGNGYVRVCEGHPFYGKEYDDIPVDVHRGLTYSNYNESDGKYFTEGYWVGFDTAHYGDTLYKWPEDAVYHEALYLFKQIYNVE